MRPWCLLAGLALARHEQCSSSELEALEMLESEPLDSIYSLHLLQMQKTLQQEQLAEELNQSLVATSFAEGATKFERFDTRPLGSYTREIGAPDMHWAVASLCFTAFFVLGSVALGSWFACRVRLKGEAEPSRTLKVFTGLFIAVLVAAAIWLSVWYFAGAVVKHWLMAYDVSFLGVEVTVGRIVINPWVGTLLVTSLDVGNPPGYNSDHMAKVGRIFIDVDMGALVKSFGHRLAIDKAEVRNVDVTYEQALTTSNVEDMLKHLGVVKTEKGGGRSVGIDLQWRLDVEVHEVNSSNVWVHALLFPMRHGLDASVPNISWHDFEKEVKPKSTDEGVIIVLATLLENSKRVLGL
ncbi:unnamed protein product [Effrenium voratum]|nr:unnamed protein product [Effrenium voratum]CAJ1424948.1 unnamed protein product [Effrenium voratum]|mmetsp:Transcript_70989/g.169376  ORF Transcript_70989/g.169376 Transcript_70989/m.169376 type:complete len:352 (-) Transcript_70989:62-1117(-)